MLNGTYDVFPFIPDYGMKVTYEYKNYEHENKNGLPFVNAQWEHPIATFNFRQSAFYSSSYDEFVAFFQSKQGSKGEFLIEDPVDHQVTADIFDTELGIIKQGSVVFDGTNYRLAEIYQLGSNVYTRYILHPAEGTVTVYNGANPHAVIIDYDTGIITTGGQSGLTWSGKFYVLARFENDVLPIQLTGYDEETSHRIYSIPDLVIKEIKEETPQITQVLDSFYATHNFSLSTFIKAVGNRRGRTSIFSSESGYELRDKGGDLFTQVDFPNRGQRLDQKELVYLVGLYRLCLGSFGRFLYDEPTLASSFIAGFTGSLSFITLVCYEDLDLYIVGVDGISLREKPSASGTSTTECHHIKITRSDGTIHAFTTHDNPITYDGDTYSPVTSITPSSNPNTADLNTDSNEIQGAFDAISANDLLAGRLEDATVEQFIYNWLDNTFTTSTFRGRIGGHTIKYIEGKALGFTLEIVSLSERLDIEVSQKTSSGCRHRFLSQGVGKCNRTIDASVQKNRTIDQVSLDGTEYTFTGTDWTGYKWGTLSFSSGIAEGKTITILDAKTNGVLKLLYAPPVLPSIGDSVVVTKHCSKSLDACARFGNVENFGGFPELTGADLSIATPSD